MNKNLFSRSPSGQSNYSKFLNNKIVAYCEGGAPLERRDVLSGKANSSADDLFFWESLFRFLFPRSNVHFKPLGSCENVMIKAKEIVANDIRNTIVLLDRDWNDYFRKITVDDRIIYTYGYSWEKDIVEANVVAEVVRTVSQCSLSELHTHRSEFTILLSNFIRCSWVLLHLQLQSERHDCGLCPTDQNFGGALSDYDKSGAIDRSSIARHYRKYKINYILGKRIQYSVTQTVRHYPGHALMGLVAKYVSRKVKGYGKPPPSFREVKSHMLSSFFASDYLNRNADAKAYYEGRIHSAIHAATFCAIEK